jgi:hypothetical protein
MESIMPKAYGFTKKGQVHNWLIQHQNEYFRAAEVAELFHATSSTVTQLLDELDLNGSWIIKKQQGGITRWRVIKKN